MKWLLKYLLLLLCCFSEATAQLLPFKTYTTKSGLMNNHITSIVRDQKGILWIGTPFGVNWFDGQQFTTPVIPQQDGPLYITGLKKDREHNIWILSFYNGLFKYDKNGFTNYLPDTINKESNANSVLDLVQLGPSKYLVATDHGVYWFDGNSFNPFDNENLSLKVQVNTITAYNDWIAIGNSNGVMVYQLDKNKWWLTARRLTHTRINKIIVGETGSIFIGTEKGLLQYESLQSLIDDKPESWTLKNKNINTLFPGQRPGDLWLSADRFYKFQNNQLQVIDEKNGLKNLPGIIYRDTEDILWLGTLNGLIKLANQHYQFYDQRTSSIHSMATSLVTDEQQNLWFGTYNGLGILNPNGNAQSMKLAGSTVGYVNWMKQSSRYGLLTGTAAGLIQVQEKKLKSISTQVTTKVFEETDGTIWAGTSTGNILKYQNLVATEIHSPAFVQDYIDAIYKDSKGALWIGYRSQGIRKYVFQNGSWKLATLHHQQKGLGLKIRCSFATGNDYLLFGTRTKGLYIISLADHEKSWFINTTNGLGSNWVKNINQDEKGNIYLATNAGLYMLTGKMENPVVRKINLLIEEMPESINDIWINQGKIWLATDQGIIKYLPGEEKRHSKAPPVYFTQVTINGKKDSTLNSYTKQSTRQLEPGNNVITFEYSGVHFQEEIPLQYRYRLRGQSDNWIYAQDRDFVSYNVPPGHYTFEVAAGNSFGQWSEEPAIFTISIPTPFYKSWWFFVIVFISFSISAFLVYRYRMRQALKLEKLRSRISTDLHDDIGSTLSSISILSEIALQEDDKSQSGVMLQEIKQSSVSLMEKMDDIVWSINPAYDITNDLLMRVKRFASRLFEARNIDYVIDIDPAIQHTRLDMETRQHIYLLMKEAINNLVKYSGCTYAAITIRLQKNYLVININDNGKGFLAHDIIPGNGLLSMKKRAEAIGGQLNIDSKPGAGTHITLKTKIK